MFKVGYKIEKDDDKNVFWIGGTKEYAKNLYQLVQFGKRMLVNNHMKYTLLPNKDNKDLVSEIKIEGHNQNFKDKVYIKISESRNELTLYVTSYIA